MGRVWLWIDTLSGAEFLALLAALAIAQFALMCMAATVLDWLRLRRGN